MPLAQVTLKLRQVVLEAGGHLLGLLAVQVLEINAVVGLWAHNTARLKEESLSSQLRHADLDLISKKKCSQSFSPKK
jgi:hypothetical protein